MSCKCFNNPPSKPSLDNCKCSCYARFLAQENGKNFEVIGVNDLSLLDKYKIDGYYKNSSSEERCDYLFVYNRTTFLFVELKGSDIEKAYKQLISTIEDIKCSCKVNTLRGFIIPSRVPLAPRLPKLKKEFRKRYETVNGMLYSKNNYLKYNPKTDNVS